MATINQQQKKKEENHKTIDSIQISSALKDFGSINFYPN